MCNKLDHPKKPGVYLNLKHGYHTYNCMHQCSTNKCTGGFILKCTATDEAFADSKKRTLTWKVVN